MMPEVLVGCSAAARWAELPAVAVDERTVVRVEATGAIRQRLLDMGILPQAEIVVQRVAPAGDPIWIELDGTQLALRGQEARAVLLERS